MAEMKIMGSRETLETVLRPIYPDMKITGGDTKLVWDADNEDEVKNAKRTFDDLRKKGFLAFAVRGKGEKGEQIRTFDGEAERLIMAPPMAGG